MVASSSPRGVRIRVVRWLSGRSRWTLLFVGAVVAALALWLLPLVVTTSPAGLTQNQRAQDVGRTRTAMLAFGAGILAVAGAFLTHDNVRIGRQQHELAQRSQFAERYATGVTQLADVEARVRLAAIYSLTALARESPVDDGAILSLMASHAREKGTLPDSFDRQAAAKRFPAQSDAGSEEVIAALVTITQAAVDRERAGWTGSLRDLRLAHLTVQNAALRGLDLSGSDMRKASLTFVDLSGANLSGALLAHSRLASVSGHKATLHATDLSRAYLVPLTLKKSVLVDAVLEEAIGSLALDDCSAEGLLLTDASLRKLETTGGDLAGASFVRATIREGTLEGTDLSSTVWEGASLFNVHFLGCSFEGAMFASTTFENVTFGTGCDLSKTEIDVATCRFKNVDMTKAKLSEIGVAHLEQAGVTLLPDPPSDGEGAPPDEAPGPGAGA